MVQPHSGELVDRKLRQGETAGYCLNQKMVGSSDLKEEGA